MKHSDGTSSTSPTTSPRTTITSATWLHSFMSWEDDDDDNASGPLMSDSSSSLHASSISISVSALSLHDDGDDDNRAPRNTAYKSAFSKRHHTSKNSSNNNKNNNQLLSSSSHSTSSTVSITTISSGAASTLKAQPPPSPELELRTSHRALNGSISALFNLLKQSGVPQPSIDQLQRNLDMERYFAVLKRCQDYIQCMSKADDDSILSKSHVLISAWEALHRYKRIQYRMAYNQSFTARHERTNNDAAIQKAVAHQIKMAEQCTAVQKKLYLIRRWQQRLFHIFRQSNRKEMAVPHGYKSVRCLR